MSKELQKTENSHLGDLSHSKAINIYVAALSGISATEATETALFDYLRNKVKLSFFEAGQDKNLDSETLNQLTSILTADIKRDFKVAKLNEIGEAFRLGVRKTYGDYFGLSVITFNEWIRGYLKSEERKFALQALNKPKPAVESHEEKAKQIFDNMLPEMLAEYKRTGKCLNFGNVRYNYLVEKGLITADHWLNYRGNAEAMLHNQLEEEKEQKWANINEVKRIKIELENMEQGEDHPRLKQESCNYAVLFWCAAEAKKFNNNNGEIKNQ